MLYKLFSVCIPVKGHSRSIIYDLHRESYEFVPNSLYDLITENEVINVELLLERFSDNRDTVLEYIDFLIEKEYIFKIEADEVELFPNLDLDWNIPTHISSTVIELFEVNLIKLEKILIQTNDLGCRSLQFLSRHITMNEVSSLLNIIEDYKFNHIEFVFSSKYYSSEQVDELVSILSNSTRRVKLILEESLEYKLLTVNNYKDLVLQVLGSYDQTKLKSINKFFSVNMELFTESQKFNNFWNKKLFINAEGIILNNFFNRKIIGNLTENNLTDIIIRKEFKELWDISKDKIQVCKDCEFRYMCVDARIPIKKSDYYTFEETCIYNPYKMTWDEN